MKSVIFKYLLIKMSESTSTKDQLGAKVDRNARERISMKTLFLVIIVCLILVLGPFSFMMYDLIQYAMPLMPAGYEMPSIREFSTMLVSAAFFLIAEPIFTKIAYPYYYKVCNVKDDEEQRVMKSKKAVVTLFKFIYFLLASTTGYMMLKDTQVLPPILGGSGSFFNHLKDWPFIKKPEGY